MANGNLSKFFAGVVRVGKGHCQRIEEDCGRFLKRHSVLALVCLSFLRIPLIDHTPSLPQIKTTAEWLFGFDSGNGGGCKPLTFLWPMRSSGTQNLQPAIK